MILDIEVTPVFEKNMDAYNDNYRIIVNQGSSRSSKTYSILQLLIIIAISKPGTTISIVRKSLPALKKSAYRDFKDILHEYNIPYKENKTSSNFTINNSLIEFFSLDDEQKVRGSKRNILYVNEANEINKLEYNQLVMRTTSTVFLDYNPSDANHFIIKEIIDKPETKFIKSTFLDNPFLEDTIIEHIMSYKDTDEDMWRVYGLGEIASGRDNVYQYKVYHDLPKDERGNELPTLIGYGLDWGYTNDQTALVKVFKHDNTIYIEEMLYLTGLTNQDIHKELKDLGLDRSDIIYADSSEPKSIEELKRMGWTIRATKKGADSVRAGIDIMKRFHLYVKGENLINEMLNYKWKKDRNGDLLNEPIDKYNHGLDAARYCVYMTQSNPHIGRYSLI